MPWHGFVMISMQARRDDPSVPDWSRDRLDSPFRPEIEPPSLRIAFPRSNLLSADTGGSVQAHAAGGARTPRSLIYIKGNMTNVLTGDGSVHALKYSDLGVNESCRRRHFSDQSTFTNSPSSGIQQCASFLRDRLTSRSSIPASIEYAA